MSQDPQASPNARFLLGEVDTRHFEARRAGNATLMSLLVHIGFVLVVMFAVANPPNIAAPPPRDPDLPREIVWLDRPGPGGGGGGGGNQMKEPPRRVELKGEQPITVPTAKPAAPKPTPPKPETPPPPAQIQVPAMQTASGVMELPGVISNVPAPSVSQGSGSGGGGGTGSGGGIGPGNGVGLGPGSTAGFGGGAYRPGNGVESPQIVYEKKPDYTADAMRLKVQGVVEVEAIVETDGSVGQVRIVRSLDDRWGLDQEALKAVRQWRFRPGTRFGKPVPVLVNIELTFSIR